MQLTKDYAKYLFRDLAKENLEKIFITIKFKSN